MNILCAWCEKEGKEAFICEAEPFDRPTLSHGICETHQKLLLLQLQLGRPKRTYPLRHVPRRHALPNAQGKNSPITLIHV